MGAPHLEDQTANDLNITGGLYADAMKSSGAGLLAENSKGTERAQGLMNAPDTFQQGLGGQPNPMSDAIRNKYMGEFNQGQRALKTQQKMDASNQYFDKLAKVKEMVGQEQQMNFEKAMAKYKAEQAKKAARGALVGQVLGIVGAVVAGAYTGGAGAAGGYMAGNAVGNAIGGS